MNTTAPETDQIQTRLDSLDVQLHKIVADLERSRRQQEVVTELVETLNPVVRGLMDRAALDLQVAEDKGYFMFAREGAAIADKVVTSFDGADVRALGDNVVTILNTVKELTQPEVMALLNRTALTIQEVEDAHIEPPSAFALLKSLRDPQTRRGLARVLSMLHTVGADTQPAPHTK